MEFPDFNNFIKKILIFFGGTDYDIFISYKRGEADLYGSSLANYLTEKKYRCYFDQYVRDEGQNDLPVALRKAVRNSTMLIVLGTKNVDNSPWILQEIETYNKRKKKSIIPVNFGDADTQRWFDQVKIFHSPKESLECLKTGTPSHLVLDTITNSFNFKKRNEQLQNRALLIMGSVIMLILVGAITTLTIVNKAKAQTLKTSLETKIAVAEKTIAKNQADGFKNQAEDFRKQKEVADSSATFAINRQAKLEDNNKTLLAQNVKASNDLLASKKELIASSMATVKAQENYRLADSSSKWQENVAEANLLASNALQELEENPTKALNQAKKAFSKYNSKITLSTLYKCYINQNQYKEIEEIPGFAFLRFGSGNTIINSANKTVQFNKLINEHVEKQSVVKLDSLKWFYQGNIIYDKKSDIVICYDKVDSSILIIENKKVLDRKLPKRIAHAVYTDFRMLKIIDASSIAYVDSSRSLISVFDWRQNKVLSTFDINKTKGLKYFGEVGDMSVWNEDVILFTVFDSREDLTKVYSWYWKKNKKAIPSIFTDNALSITSIQKIRILDKDYLCIGNSDGEVSIWNAKRKLLTIPIQDGTIKKMEAYGDTLVVISNDNKIQVLRFDAPYTDSGSGKIERIATLKGHTNELFDFDFNTRNGLLLSSDTDYESSAKLWHINLPQPISLDGKPPLSLFSSLTDFIYDTDEIGSKKDHDLFDHFYLIKDSIPLPFINSKDFQSVNVNAIKDQFIVCSKNSDHVYIMDIKGNRIDSIPVKEKKINQNYKEYYRSADFTNNDSLIVVVTNLRRSLRSSMEHVLDDYIVYIYNRKWEEITSFPINSNRNVVVWNDYLYKITRDSYIKTLINPALINVNDNL